MMLAGLSSIVVIEIYTSVMQLKFQDTDNKVGKAFAVLGIYLFVVAYCKILAEVPSLTWGAELVSCHTDPWT